MIESLALDALLLLVLLLLIPIGLYRGGLREVCSAAGLLLGLLVADAWSARWGAWLAEATGINQGVARFGVAVLTLVTITGAVGYGAAAAFAHKPGPGGRLYGGVIALFTGIVFLGALIEFVRRYLYDNELPAMVRDGYLSRLLANGFDWVLLFVALGTLAATLFGMLVRERDADIIPLEQTGPPTPVRRAPVPAMAPEPEPMEPAQPSEAEEPLPEPTTTVRIREVRHWEDQAPPTLTELHGWTQTWPAVDREPTIKGRSAAKRGRIPADRSGRPPAGSQDDDVLRTWLEQDQRSSPAHPDRKPQSDE